MSGLEVALDTLRNVAETLHEVATNEEPGEFADGITFAARIVEEAHEALS